MPLKLPLHVVALRNLTMFVVLIVLIRIFVSIQDFLVNPNLWMLIAVVTYWICTSGIVYVMINGSPYAYFDYNEYGQVVIKEYFKKSLRAQYGIEGQITATINLLAAGCFMLLLKADKLFKTAFSRRVAIAVALFGAGFFTYWYVFFYRLKAPWYENKFWPPEHYTRGPLMRDQGNNI